MSSGMNSEYITMISKHHKVNNCTKTVQENSYFLYHLIQHFVSSPSLCSLIVHRGWCCLHFSCCYWEKQSTSSRPCISLWKTASLDLPETLHNLCCCWRPFPEVCLFSQCNLVAQPWMWRGAGSIPKPWGSAACSSIPSASCHASLCQGLEHRKGCWAHQAVLGWSPPCCHTRQSYQIHISPCWEGCLESLFGKLGVDQVVFNYFGNTFHQLKATCLPQVCCKPHLLYDYILNTIPPFQVIVTSPIPPWPAVQLWQHAGRKPPLSQTLVKTNCTSTELSAGERGTGAKEATLPSTGKWVLGGCPNGLEPRFNNASYHRCQQKQIQMCSTAGYKSKSFYSDVVVKRRTSQNRQ